MGGHTDDARIARPFDKPSVEGLRALSQADFQELLDHVFQRAGYIVKRPLLGFVSAVDLDLFTSTNPHAQVGAVATRQTTPDRPLSADFVRSLQRSVPVRKRSAAAYAVTSGAFDKAAYQQAGTGQHTYLLDGEALCRYIRYVRSSRFPEHLGLTVVIPPDLFASRPSPHVTGRARILVFANNKGGVGKTTSVRQVALTMAERGLRVLVVDMDPQENLTEALSPRNAIQAGHSSAARPSLVQYFTGDHALTDLVRPTEIEKVPVENVFLIPSHPDLSLLDTGGAGRPALEMRFARDLWELASAPFPPSARDFDWVIVDTPPAISLFTRAALCAADYVVTPARSRPSSLTGIRNMLKTLDAMGELRGSVPKVLGCLITHWDDDQHSTETYPYLEAILDDHGSRILATYIPFDKTVEKTHGPMPGRAMRAYADVTKEVLEYVDRS